MKIVSFFNRLLYNIHWEYYVIQQNICSGSSCYKLIDSVGFNGFNDHQPLWVILCCLPKKGREEIVEKMKEDREERRKWKKVTKKKK